MSLCSGRLAGRTSRRLRATSPGRNRPSSRPVAAYGLEHVEHRGPPARTDRGDHAGGRCEQDDDAEASVGDPEDRETLILASRAPGPAEEQPDRQLPGGCLDGDDDRLPSDRRPQLRAGDADRSRIPGWGPCNGGGRPGCHSNRATISHIGESVAATEAVAGPGVKSFAVAGTVITGGAACDKQCRLVERAAARPSPVCSPVPSTRSSAPAERETRTSPGGTRTHPGSTVDRYRHDRRCPGPTGWRGP